MPASPHFSVLQATKNWERGYDSIHNESYLYQLARLVSSLKELLTTGHLSVYRMDYRKGETKLPLIITLANTFYNFKLFFY